MNLFKKQFLYILGSFLAGFSVMTIELTSSRIMAPIIGSSVFTWTSVIGITLFGLSIGSWVGGRLADRTKDNYILSFIFLISAVFVSIIPPLSKNTDFITNSSNSILLLNLMISVYLFLLPAFTIGLIQPLILKKYADDFSKIGTRYGLLSAIWSIGSLLGVFLTGFYFISYIGSAETMWLTAIILFITGILFAFSKKSVLIFFLIIGITIPTTVLYVQRNILKRSSAIFEKETNYYTARVVDTNLPALGDSRILFLDFDSHSIETKTVNQYLYPEMYPVFGHLKPDIKSILAIGAGAYTLPKYFKENYKNADVSVIETDPAIEKIGTDYFDLKKYNIKTIVGDAKIIIKKDSKKYDVIFGDAYNSFIAVPWYLLTKEWNDQIRGRLTDNGIYAINFIGSLNNSDEAFTESVVNTFKQSFPNFYAFSFGSSPDATQNITLVGIKGDLPLSENDLKKELSKGPNSFLADRVLPISTFTKESSIILTDNFSPVEKLMLPLIYEYFPKNLFFTKKLF